MAAAATIARTCAARRRHSSTSATAAIAIASAVRTLIARSSSGSSVGTA